MPPLKLYYLSAEIAPFSATYEIASFSRKITSILHETPEIDIRISQPKYGFVSERKYILREVIRLKDIPVDFSDKRLLVNMKSSFIPETRVQVYFIEHDPFYKSIPELIYKARNGRVYNDNDQRFTFFSKAALETLTSLFWAPDVMVCNDWQTALVPILLKKQYQKEEFYSNMKSVYLIHSVNNYRKFSRETYDFVGVSPEVKGSVIDNHIQAMENADLIIAVNYESSNLMTNLKKQKKLYQIFEQTDHLVIDIPKKTDRDLWKNAAYTIETACRTL